MQKTVVRITDDLDGEEAPDAETIQFAVDGTSYEIDLKPDHAAELRTTLSRYTTRGRKLGKVSGRTSPRSNAASVVDNAEVRRWAQSQGMDVSMRGRLSAELVNLYLNR